MESQFKEMLYFYWGKGEWEGRKNAFNSVIFSHERTTWIHCMRYILVSPGQKSLKLFSQSFWGRFETYTLHVGNSFDES